MSFHRTRAGKLPAASAICLAFALICVASANAQMTVGDNLSMTLTGNLGAGYSGSFGNYVASSHNQGVVIDGYLDGYYFHPQFLSFQVRPYFDRAQANSDFQTITRNSGVAASVNLFGGSRFPGAISYGRDFSSNSEFRIAGVPSLLGDSSGSNFGVSWSALLEGLPSLHASYSIADSTSTLLGATAESKSSSKNFNLSSDYKLGGFNLHGGLNHYNVEFSSPGFISASPFNDASSNTSYYATATRKLPLSGSLGLGWTRTASESGTSEFTGNSYSATANFVPWRRLVISEYIQYTTNVLAAFSQSLGNNVPVSLTNRDSESNTLYLNTAGTFRAGFGFTLTGYLNHRRLHFQGRDLENTQYGGTVNFQKTSNLFGLLHVSVGIVDTATKEGNSSLGLVANVSMMRKFDQWEASADFSYSQSTQTIYTIATTSNYSYGGMIRRKFNSTGIWHAGFRESRSGFSAQEGNSNVADTVSTGLFWKRYAVSGNYSRSRGSALLAYDGTLTATPPGSIISDDFLTYNARSYGVNASTRLFRIVTVSGGYTNVSSSTVRRTSETLNDGDRYFARLQVRFRRLTILGGYNRAAQEASAVPGGPRVVNSFYVSLSRWFQVF